LSPSPSSSPSLSPSAGETLEDRDLLEDLGETEEAKVLRVRHLTATVACPEGRVVARSEGKGGLASSRLGHGAVSAAAVAAAAVSASAAAAAAATPLEYAFSASSLSASLAASLAEDVARAIVSAWITHKVAGAHGHSLGGHVANAWVAARARISSLVMKTAAAADLAEAVAAAHAAVEAEADACRRLSIGVISSGTACTTWMIYGYV
tara:strand:+ start:2064 stop:2687 length:624 start_codon:yes stop_codon:yes gene_type:complete